MMKVEFHPEADQELAEAKRWYRKRSRLAARAFATAVTDALQDISVSPHRWPETRLDERRLVLAKFLSQLFIASEKTESLSQR
jgi:hypothetical protein